MYIFTCSLIAAVALPFVSFVDTRAIMTTALSVGFAPIV